MRTIKSHYFKDDGSGRSLISGLPIPKDPDGVVRNIRFVDCDFHPACWPEYRKPPLVLENCEFICCDGGEEMQAPAPIPKRLTKQQLQDRGHQSHP